MTGSGLTITDSGTIAGGYGNGGAGAQADAIDFTGGANSLTLAQVWDLSGGLGLDNGATLSLNVNQAGTYGGVIYGTGSLTFNGPQTLVLSGVNTYSGGTTLDNGTLKLVGSGTLGAATGSLDVLGGTLDLNGTSQSVGALSGSVAGTISLGGGSLNVNEQGASTTYAGVINGAGSLVVDDTTGTGTLTLSGVNSTTGGTQVLGGTLQVSSDAALGASGAALTLDGGTLQSGASFTLARPVDLGAPQGVVNLAGQDLTMSGVISGLGELVVDDTVGTGMLTLSGTNTYSGGTVLDAGGLTLMSGQALGTGEVSFAGPFSQGVVFGQDMTVSNAWSFLDSGTFAFDTQGYTVILSGDASTVSSLPRILRKTGSGEMILDGAVNTSVEVAQGTLEEGDATHSGAIAGATTVDSGATLCGYGTVGVVGGGFAGGLTNSGVVAPGDGIGVLHVQGQYIQNSTGTLRIELNPTQSSSLSIAGTASLAGGLQLVADPGVYQQHAYTILSASGGVSGTFSSVEGGPSGFDPALRYTPGAVDLSLNVVAPTQDTVALALDDQALVEARQSEEMLLGRLDDLTLGVGGEGSAEAAAQGAVAGEAAGLWPGLTQAAQKLGLWVQAQGNLDHVQADSATTGYQAQGGGLSAGLDKALWKGFVGGVSVGDSHTYVMLGDGETGSLDTPRAEVYGSQKVGRFGVEGTLGYAEPDFQSWRPIAGMGETASTQHWGTEGTGALQADTLVEVKGVKVLPKVGVDGAYVGQGSFVETGATGYDLAMSRQSDGSLRPYVGAEATKEYKVLGVEWEPKVDLEWSHETLNPAVGDTAAVGGGSFAVQGVALSRDELEAGAGVSAGLGKRLSLYADYLAIVPTGDLAEEDVQGGLDWRF